MIEDDKGDDGTVDGVEGNNNGTKTRKDDVNDEVIIDGDGAAEWEDFKADIHRMLPHPQCYPQRLQQGRQLHGRKLTRVCAGQAQSLMMRCSQPSNGGGALSPIRTGCMNIGMDLDDGGCIPGDGIEHKLTINY